MLHLNEETVPTTLNHSKEVKAKAHEFLDTLTDILSENEYYYIRSTINKCNVPIVSLLVKDHKKKKLVHDVGRVHPTRMVTPAKNFTTVLAQHGVKHILDKHKINYSKKTIIQASDLKEKLEKLQIHRSRNSISLVDCIAMYPSIKFLQIKLEYFLRDAPEEDKVLLHCCCLEMVKFSMENTLIQFNDAYYEYGGKVDVNNKGLTIGGFESAFFACLVAVWILENTEEQMNDVMLRLWDFIGGFARLVQ
jgi:hypothetical protein